MVQINLGIKLITLTKMKKYFDSSDRSQSELRDLANIVDRVTGMTIANIGLIIYTHVQMEVHLSDIISND